MTIGDLTYSLGAVWDKGSLKNIKDGLASVSKTFITAVGVASGSLAGVFGAVKSFAGANDELGKLARNRDIAVDSLQALQYSFEGAGVEASKVGDVLDKLQEQKGKFAQGTADMDAFARIGINPNAYSDTESFFNATIDGLKNIKDEALRADLSKRLLGSADLNNLIDGGSDAIKKQKKELKELGVLIDNQDYKKSAKFNDTLLKTTTIMKGLINKIMIKLMPIFTGILENFNTFMSNNAGLINWIKSFFEVLIRSLQLVFSLIGRVIGQILAFKPALYLIAGLFVLWQLPIILTIGAITALFILLDELFSFLNNEDSLIGDWLGVSGIEEFKSKFPKITATFKAVSDTLIAMFTYLKDSFFNLWDMLSGKISFGEMLENQLSIVGDLLESLKDIFMRFVDWLVSLFDDIDIFGGISRQIDKVKNTISDFIPDMPTLDGALSFIGLGGDDKKQPAPVPVDSNSTTTHAVTNNYNISADVNATNKNIGEALKELTNPAGY